MVFLFLSDILQPPIPGSREKLNVWTHILAFLITIPRRNKKSYIIGKSNKLS